MSRLNASFFVVAVVVPWRTTSGIVATPATRTIKPAKAARIELDFGTDRGVRS